MAVEPANFAPPSAPDGRNRPFGPAADFRVPARCRRLQGRQRGLVRRFQPLAGFFPFGEPPAAELDDPTRDWLVGRRVRGRRNVDPATARSQQQQEKQDWPRGGHHKPRYPSSSRRCNKPRGLTWQLDQGTEPVATLGPHHYRGLGIFGTGQTKRISGTTLIRELKFATGLFGMCGTAFLWTPSCPPASRLVDSAIKVRRNRRRPRRCCRGRPSRRDSRRTNCSGSCRASEPAFSAFISWPSWAAALPAASTSPA